MRGRYDYLAGRLRQLGIRQSDLGDILGICHQAVSHRFRDRTPWTLDEMYRVLELCRAAPEELHIYFPPASQAAKKARPAA